LSTSEDRPNLAVKLERLFREIRPPQQGGRSYTNDEVAETIGVSGAYVSALRKGTRTNPSHEVLAGLAQFFGVKISYFLDDLAAEQTEAEIALARVMGNHGVRALALRALELSPQGLAAVTQMIEEVLKADQDAEGTERPLR
jgi:transcriptional regulator with XRE-family HTH domain